jgi:hypothetical protein
MACWHQRTRKLCDRYRHGRGLHILGSACTLLAGVGFTGREDYRNSGWYKLLENMLGHDSVGEAVLVGFGGLAATPIVSGRTLDPEAANWANRGGSVPELVLIPRQLTPVRDVTKEMFEKYWRTFDLKSAIAADIVYQRPADEKYVATPGARGQNAIVDEVAAKINEAKNQAVTDLRRMEDLIRKGQPIPNLDQMSRKVRLYLSHPGHVADFGSAVEDLATKTLDDNGTLAKYRIKTQDGFQAGRVDFVMPLTNGKFAIFDITTAKGSASAKIANRYWRDDVTEFLIDIIHPGPPK